jgi:hypothetical protein
MTERRANVQTLEIPYNRTLGPVVGKFLTGLRDGEIFGNKTKSGKVLCPPFEYDADTGEATTGEFVSLPDTGVVTSWAWVREPLRYHLIADKPFAWALIQIDGADTSLLHAVDAGSPERMSTGMRVRVRWRRERIGHIRDIECFEPE